MFDYFGATDNSYTKATIRKTMVAAEARIYRPGTKFDSVLILNGPQGIGKSKYR
ncbi:VapE domain-containing protein [Bacillus licheniformis]|uniref:VapE domain-containing protein n=1 Tax=Bacillus licheniformis TaxID=1402 RepID=UPI0028BD87F8|nr:VapE domain-containing protein [Bacillus licheniformis]MDH3162728.1 VapE family protein [Bacillus licheniformis]MED4411326.1 VapE family protein [Bacillus licheniformis]